MILRHYFREPAAFSKPGRGRLFFCLTLLVCVLLSAPAQAAANAQVSVTATPAVISAGGTSSIQVVVSDLTGPTSDTGGSSAIPLHNAQVTLSTSSPGITFSPSSGTTDAQGRFTSTLTSASSASGTVSVFAVAILSRDFYGTGTGTVTIRIPAVILPEADQQPVAVIQIDHYTGTAPLTVQFDGRQSYSPTSAVRSYAWDFGDGTTGDGYVSAHTYTNTGSYTAHLMVTDNAGLRSASDSVVITAGQSAAASRPEAVIVVNQSFGPAPLAVAFEPNGRFTYAIPDNILFGDTIRPFMYLRQYTKAISTCSGACVYNDAPKKNQRVVFTIYKAGAAFGDTVNSTTDQNGRVAVPNAINVEYGDTMSVHSSNPSGWLAYWKGVAASSVKIKMQRLDANYNYYELLEGGTVSASFWDWHRDKAVIVSIENQPTQFLNMDLVEYADFPGRLLIAPLPRRDTEDAYGTQLPVIFPTSGRKYFFAVPKEAVPGHFELSLLKPSDFTLLDSTTAHLTTDHFDFTCDREDRPVNEGPSTPATRECSGNFSLVLSDGRTVDHVFARSGEHLIDGGTYYTALPDGIYYVSEIGRKPLNSVKCDNYHNCWFADLRPIPFDDNVGRFREDLGIHPVIGNGLTHGCIGLDKTVNTYYLYTFIDSFHRKYGDTLEVKVHP